MKPSTLSFEEVLAARGSEDSSESQNGLLKLWWGLIQDQMSTLNREIESLRQANSQMEARQSQFVQFLSEQQNSYMSAKESQETLAEQITQEKKTREGHISELKIELQQWVREEFDSEFNQTKTMLAAARQMLDSDETLKLRLDSLLQTEMVSKKEFSDETAKLWSEVKYDRLRDRAPSRSSRPVSPTRTPIMPPPLVAGMVGSFRSPRAQSIDRAMSPLRSMASPQPVLPGSQTLLLGSQTLSMRQPPPAFSPGARSAPLAALSPRASDLKPRAYTIGC